MNSRPERKTDTANAQNDRQLHAVENDHTGSDVNPPDTYLVDTAGNATANRIDPEDDKMGRPGAPLRWLAVVLGLIVVLAVILALF